MKTFIRFLSICIALFSVNCYGQSLSDLTYDTSNNQADQLLNEIVINVYDQTLTDFNNEIEAFTATLTKDIEQLGVYSDAAALQFNQKCDQELDRATKEIHQISENAVHQYYNELAKNGLSSTVGVTDPVAQKLENDINSVEFDMISEMKSVIAILQSNDPLPDLGQEIVVGVDTYQKLAAEEYARQEAKASQAKKTSQWQDIKLAGADFLAVVGVDLKKECTSALTDAATDTLKDMGKDAANEAAAYGKSVVGL